MISRADDYIAVMAYAARMWSDVSTRHLLALQAVAAEGTFGRAALRLGFTQSAVSQQIATLEQTVGQALFDRPSGPRPPTLTPAGRLLLRHADELLTRFDAAERELERFAQGAGGRLVIGTFQSISARLLPMTLRTLNAESPDVEIVAVEDDHEDDFRLGAVRRGEVDLAFVIGNVDERMASLHLGTDPHVMIVPAGHPEGPVSLAELDGAPMVGQPTSDACGREIDMQLGRHGVVPRFAFRTLDNGAVQGMVSAGVGPAIMPLLSVDQSDPTISVRTTDPPLEPRQLWLAWNAERTLAPAAQRFIEIVADVCARELAKGLAAIS